MRSEIQKRRWLRWVGAIAGLLLIAVIAFHALLPVVAARVAGSLMGVSVSVGDVDFSVLGDSLVVEDVRVAQPDGFGNKPLFELGRIAVDGWLGALSGSRKIKEIRVEKLRLEFISKADGTSNLAALFAPTSTEKNAEAPGSSQAPAGESAKKDLPAIVVDLITVSSVALVGRVQLEGGNEYRLELLSDQLTVNRLAIGAVADMAPGDIELIGGIVQPGVARAEVYLGGRFSELGTGSGNLRVSARVTGCLFDTFVPIIPSNTGDILGGKGFDAGLEIKTAGGLIDVEGGLLTPNDSTYAFTARGPLDAPEIKLPKKLKAVTSRMAGGAGRIVRGAIGGGSEIIGGTARTVTKVGKGTLSAAGNVIKGAGESAVGVVTADTERIKSGAGMATVDAGGNVVDAVDDSAQEIADTGGNTVGALGKDPATLEWLAAVPARHGKRIDGLLSGILAEKFPPVIEGSTASKKK